MKFFYEFYAIGENKYGLLCTGNEKKCHSPTLLSNECFQNIIYIATGIKHVIALNKFGEVYAWGYNDSGQLGKFYCRKPNYKPFILNKFKRQKIFKISCGFYHSVALTNSGELFAWGQNSKLQCGSAYNYNYFEPMRLKKPETVSFVSISCGSHHTIALDKRGNVYAWGSNNSGQLGFGSSKKYHLLRRVEFRNIIIKKIKCGKDHSLVLSTEGDIYAFGKNKYGQIGNGSNIDKIKPVKSIMLRNLMISRPHYILMLLSLYQRMVFVIFGGNSKIIFLKPQLKHN
jgi:alpha-tubulin suppressor-like RCC1 family protein